MNKKDGTSRESAGDPNCPKCHGDGTFVTVGDDGHRMSPVVDCGCVKCTCCGHQRNMHDVKGKCLVQFTDDEGTRHCRCQKFQAKKGDKKR
jgi:hypothetical protein